jgi:hypothetical protein
MTEPRAAGLEIFGQSSIQLPHEQLRIFPRPDPDNDINSLFNQIDQPIR